MDKLQNAVKIFGLENNQYTIADIKAIYRQLASKNHPDKGGHTENMQLINAAFEEFCKFFVSNDTLDINQVEDAHSFDFSFIDALRAMAGVIIEVCGYWVWLTGNTYAHKDQIHALGFKYSKAKKSWYWSPTINDNNFRRGSKSMKEIRTTYGSQIIENQAQYVLN